MNLIANSDQNISQITYDPSATLRTGHRNLAQRIKTDNGLHSYTYNHEGLRIGKQYSPAGQDDWSVNTRYVYGAYGELLAQYDGLSHQYWNISTPEGETIGRMEASPPESKDDILAMKAGTFTAYDRYYYLKDHLGSIRVTLKDNGSVAGYDDYYPFGLQMPGRSSNTANTHADQKFTGHFLESEGNLGLYHAQARLYDPEVPRFYGVDAMRGMYPGHNPYNYVMNNPLTFADPTGNCAALLNAGSGKWEGEEAQDMFAQCVGEQDPPEENDDTADRNVTIDWESVNWWADTSSNGIATLTSLPLAQQQLNQLRGHASTVSKNKYFGIASSTASKINLLTSLLSLYFDFTNPQVSNTRTAFRAGAFAVSWGVGFYTGFAVGTGGLSILASGAVIGLYYGGEYLYDHRHHIQAQHNQIQTHIQAQKSRTRQTSTRFFYELEMMIRSGINPFTGR